MSKIIRDKIPCLKYVYKPIHALRKACGDRMARKIGAENAAALLGNTVKVFNVSYHDGNIIGVTPPNIMG